MRAGSPSGKAGIPCIEFFSSSCMINLGEVTSLVINHRHTEYNSRESGSVFSWLHVQVTLPTELIHRLFVDCTDS